MAVKSKTFSAPGSQETIVLFTNFDPEIKADTNIKSWTIEVQDTNRDLLSQLLWGAPGEMTGWVRSFGPETAETLSSWTWTKVSGRLAGIAGWKVKNNSATATSYKITLAYSPAT